MATLYGGAMPDDFVSGEELTATEFNKVKNYWIVDGDLPEGPEILDGDVVFVLGDAVGTPEAEITAITGSGITHTYGDFVAFEFLTSGSLTCTEGLIPEALIVAGGGGGGTGVNSGQRAGGGGAGGFAAITSAYFSAATHTATVGAGGIGASISGHPGANGISSQVGNYAAVGGGAGAGFMGGSGSRDKGFSGGSGGGGCIGQPGGLGVLNQGNAGGTGYASNPYWGGGGGGAGSVGTNATSVATGVGGSGSSSSLTGTDTTFSAGGDGSTITTGASGTVNTGNGGAGGTTTGGAGGSGVVIVKVKASNAANVDKSGWTEVTAAMLAAAEKKREVERKAQAKKAALLAKNEELSGATQTDIEETE